MNVLVDTSVWSLALRRRQSGDAAPLSTELTRLVQAGRVAMIGPIRQEILSGIRERAQFERLRDHLRAFPDVEVTTADYEEAARHFTACRQKGIQGSNTDFLLCAVALRYAWPILTADGDFAQFARVLPVVLHAPGA